MTTMDEYVEKLIVALMVLLDEQGGERRIDSQKFNAMFEARHQKGIQVKELGDKGIVLKLGDMAANPDDAMLN